MTSFLVKSIEIYSNFLPIKGRGGLGFSDIVGNRVASYLTGLEFDLRFRLEVGFLTFVQLSVANGFQFRVHKIDQHCNLLNLIYIAFPHLLNYKSWGRILQQYLDHF